MAYTRVIPRDLFNEASLLKCLGRLAILLENRNGAARFDAEDLPSFDIVQREDDGAIYMENLRLAVGEERYRLSRPLNSRRPWPLYAELIDASDFDPVDVYDDEGNLTADMLKLIGD